MSVEAGAILRRDAGKFLTQAVVIGEHHRTTVQAPVVTGPDGNGTVKVSIDTTGMAVGLYKVTITGRVLTQTISFLVVPEIG
jgi:hypothetical protein